MKTLSMWAYQHPVKSRMVIALLHTLISGMAIYGGIRLFAHGIWVPQTVFYAAVTLFLTAYFFYPIRHARYAFWKFHYVRHKTMDFALVTSFVMMVTTISNHDAHAAWRSNESDVQAVPVMLKSDLGKKWDVEKARTGGWKNMQKSLRSRYKQFVTAVKDNSGDEKKERGTGGIIGLMVLLMLLVAVLGCIPACNGSEAAAIAIIVIGWTVILVLGVAWIRKVKGRSVKNATYESMPQTD